jgi:hypothetical protein
VTYDNSAGAPYWEDAIHAAIYVNGVLQSEGVIIDPASTLIEAEGRSGMIIASYAPIAMDQPYSVEIFLYTYGNQTVNRVSAWAGAIQHTDHATEAVVELLELTDM